MGGGHGAANIELHCGTHNRMKARQVFGEAFIAAKMQSAKKMWFAGPMELNN